MVLMIFHRWEDYSTNPTRSLDVSAAKTITAYYVPAAVLMGFFNITTTPSGAPILIDGVPVGNSTVLVDVTANIEHTVTFGPIAGYVAPVPRTSMVSAGGTIQMHGEYIPSPPSGRLPWALAGLSMAALVGVTLYRPKKKK